MSTGLDMQLTTGLWLIAVMENTKLLSAQTKQSTTFTQVILMTQAAFEKQVQKLVAELAKHPHKEEIMELMHEQLLDDQSTHYAHVNCSA